MGQQKKKPLRMLFRILYPPILYLLISTMIQEIFIMCYTMVATMGYTGPQDDINAIMQYTQSQAFLDQIWEMIYENAMVISLAVAFVCIPLFYLLYTKDQKNRPRQKQVLGWYPWMLVLVLGVSACISLNDWISLSNLIEIFPGYEEVAQQLYGGSLFIEFLAIGIAAPIVEELIFRGLVYKRMRDVVNIPVAMVFAALIFGLMHMNMVQGLYAFLLGLLLCYIYEVYHTIWAPILFHAMSNIVSVVITELIQPFVSQSAFGMWTEVVLMTALMLVSLYGIIQYKNSHLRTE